MSTTTTTLPAPPVVPWADEVTVTPADEDNPAQAVAWRAFPILTDQPGGRRPVRGD